MPWSAEVSAGVGVGVGVGAGAGTGMIAGCETVDRRLRKRDSIFLFIP